MLFGRFSLAAPAALFAVALAVPELLADEKMGMPDLAQIEQTCLPTSTANLILWFGHHGYPKLIQSGDTTDERELHTVHRIMKDTEARFDWGTRMDGIATGIEKYIHESGYACEVEYRGLDGKGTAFSEDWLRENDDANKGFILLLAYCHLDPAAQVLSPAWNAGHAVTLVNAEPGLLLVHDPAHENDETGRKILTPSTITEATWQDKSGSQSANGLLLLSGSLLDAPPNTYPILIGAVCITMHPPETIAASHPATSITSDKTIGHAPTGAASTRPAASSSWWGTLFDYFFSK